MDNKQDYQRVGLTISKDLNDWLHGFIMKIKGAGGFKVPKTLILRSFVRAIKETNIEIDLSNIKTKKTGQIGGLVSSDKIEDMLTGRIKKAIQKR